MGWVVKKPTAIEVEPNRLKPYSKRFSEELITQGYAAATMRTYDTASRLLCEEIVRRGLRKGEFAGRMLLQVRAAVLKAIRPDKHTLIQNTTWHGLSTPLWRLAPLKDRRFRRRRRRRLIAWWQNTRPISASSVDSPSPRSTTAYTFSIALWRSDSAANLVT